MRESTTACESRIEIMRMFCNLGQLLPRPSTMVVRSVHSFSWREKSREISFKFGQLKTYIDHENPILSTNIQIAQYKYQTSKDQWLQNIHHLGQGMKTGKP